MTDVITSIVINNEVVSVGDSFMANTYAPEFNICDEGRIATVTNFLPSGSNVTVVIRTTNSTGMPVIGRISRELFKRIFYENHETGRFTAGCTYYKGKNLSGKKGKILQIINTETFLVEFDDNIKGGGGDGCGTMGHCLVVNKSDINFEERNDNRTEEMERNKD